MANNKVRYGLSNVHVWPITGEEAGKEIYGETIKLLGAVKLAVSPTGDSTPFYADNRTFFTTSSSSGFEGELEIAMLTEEFETEILGMKIDENGAIYEDDTPKTQRFAMAYQFEGDQKATRHILYVCQASRPEEEANTTTDTTEPDVTVLTFSATKNLAGVSKARLASDKTGYDAFFDAPYELISPTPEI